MTATEYPPSRLPPGEEGTALFLGSMRNRRAYLTRRWWKESGPESTGLLAWIGLNPSSADAGNDDPTIRRVRGFTKRAGYDGIVMLNLSIFVATEPRDLVAALDRGAADTMEEAFDQIRRWAPHVAGFVPAWGASVEKSHHMIHRAGQAGTLLEGLAETYRVPLLCLGRTKQGHPRHPLYLSAETPFQPWGAR